MAKVIASVILKDSNSLEADGNNLRVKIDAGAALERTASGLDVKSLGITNDMLSGSITLAKLADGANIVLDNGTHTITGTITAGADNLQITGTPDSGNDAVNKTYVDNQSSGLSWQEPAYVKELIGSDAALDIEGLTPTAGDAYVVDTANGAGALSAATVGDIWEYDGAAWNLIVAGVGGFVADGVRALAATQTALNGTLGLTDGADDGKILDWDGTSLTPTVTTTLNGWALLITDQDNDGDSIYANLGYTYQGTTPSGVWTQFTGAGQINAGTGLTKSANTLNVGDGGKGVQVNADDVQVDASEIAGNGLAQVAGGGNEHLLTINPDTTGTATISVDANGVKIATTAAGNGLTGGGTAALSVEQDVTTNVADGVSVTVGANGLSIDGDLINVDQTLTNITPDTGGTGVDAADLASIILGIDNALGTFGSGDVTGPGSSTDNAIARFDGATGKTIQNSGVLIDDSNNMTVPGNVIVQGQAGSALHDIGTTSGTITPDLDNANVQKVTLSGNATLANPTNPVSGHTYVIKVAQNGTGGFTLAFGSKWKFPTYLAGTGPDISTGANDVSIISAVYDGGDDLYYAELSNDEAISASAIVGVEIRKKELLTVAGLAVTLSETPVDGSAVQVIERNGIEQVNKALDGTTYDYAVSGTTVDFDDTGGTTGDILNGTEVIVEYTYASS